MAEAPTSSRGISLSSHFSAHSGGILGWPSHSYSQELPEMIVEISKITAVTSLIGFIIGLPTVIATYYQSFKARQEAQ
jgi:hypothetical protein